MPDILNRTTKRWAEIKPFSYSGVLSGSAQYLFYLNTFEPFRYWPDAGWKPSTHTTLAGAVPILFWNAGGIIFYTDAVALEKEALLLTSVALAKQYFLKNSARLAGRTLVPAMARIAGLAFAGRTADTARLRIHFDIALLLAPLGAL
jgi:hypothetical protein